MRQRNKYIQLRLTEKEQAAIKEKSVDYYSMSNYVRTALNEFSGVGAKERIDLIVRLGQFYEKWSSELGHMGGNLNQSVKRANELSQAGLLSSTYMERLLVEISQVKAELMEIKRELLAVSKRGRKL